MNISKRKIAGFAAGVVALSLVVGSWAYYTSTNSIDNQMKTKKYGDTLVEKFTPDENWQPGEEATKEVGVKNTGDYSLVVRVKMEEIWTNADGDEIKNIKSTEAAEGANVGIDKITDVKQENVSDGLVANDKTVVEKTMATSEWTKGTDGYWYYNTQLAAGDSTNYLLSKIKLANDADLGKYTSVQYYHEGTDAPAFEPGAEADTGVATTGWKAFTGAVPSPAVATNSIFTRVVSNIDSTAAGYAGATYDLIITSETCQATRAAVNATFGGGSTFTAPTGTSWGF